MGITDVIPALLICQHLANVYGDIPFYQQNTGLPLQPLQPLDQPFQLLEQSLQQLDQSLRQTFSPSQQSNLPQQQFPPFQQPNLPQQPLPPFQQPNLPQQPLPPFQQPNLPQQPIPPFQQPNLPHQQPYLPLQQQPYRPYQQPYPPLQQQSFNLLPLQQFQPPTCPLPAPFCTDGRPAVCTRNAVTGFPAYYCLNPSVQNGFSWPPGIPGMGTPPSVIPTFSGPNLLNSTGSGYSGGRSLLELLTGSNSESAPQPSIETNSPTGQGYNGFDTRNQVMNPPLSFTNGPYYPSSKPICSFKNPSTSGCPNSCCFQLPVFLGACASGPCNVQPCRPCSYNAPLGIPPPPLSQAGYPQPGSPGALPVSTFGPPAAPPPTNVPQPGFLNFHPHSSPARSPSDPYLSQGLATMNDVTLNPYDSGNLLRHGNPFAHGEFPPLDSHRYMGTFTNYPYMGNFMNPGSQLPSYTGLGLYQSPVQLQIPGPFASNQQMLPSYTIGNEPKLQDTNPFPMFSKFMNYMPLGQQPIIQPSHHYNTQNQPNRNEPQAYQNQPQYVGGVHSPVYQPTLPNQLAGNPSIFPDDLNFRQPERPPQLRPLESPGYQPPSSLSYAGLSQLPYENAPTAQGTQSLITPQNNYQNPFTRTQGNLGYQVPGMSGSMSQGVQSPLQPGFQNNNHFSSPLGFTQPWTLKQNPDTEITRYQPLPYSQNLPTPRNYSFEKNKPQAKVPHFQTSGTASQNPQNLRPYLSSGLSLLSLLDEEPPREQKWLGSGDKNPTKPAKKNSNRTKKPSSSSSWLGI